MIIHPSPIANGRYAQKTSRQLVRSVITPPTTRPLAPAAAPAALHTAIAFCRCGPARVMVVSRRKADGTEVAADMPCRHLATVSTSTDPAVAATIAPAAKTARLTRIIRR